MTRLGDFYRGAERGNQPFGELACWRASLTLWAVVALLFIGAIVAAAVSS